MGVSDAISMGTGGMRYSLQSRDLIADSVETVAAAQFYDGVVTIAGCDKNMPGCVMGMGRLNRPSLMIYGGSIRRVSYPRMGKINIVDAFEGYGKLVAGTITPQERAETIQCACPGAGACGGMYTANTMGTLTEAMGLSLPYSACTPADAKARRMCRGRCCDQAYGRDRFKTERYPHEEIVAQRHRRCFLCGWVDERGTPLTSDR